MAFYLPAPVESSSQADAFSVFTHSHTIGFHQQRLDGLERGCAWVEYGNPRHPAIDRMRDDLIKRCEIMSGIDDASCLRSGWLLSK
jgi:hypothetical protein